jgi:hypothetical protein
MYYHSHIIISAIKFEQHVKNVENVQQFSKLEEKRIRIKIKKGTMILNSLLLFFKKDLPPLVIKLNPSL